MMELELDGFVLKVDRAPVLVADLVEVGDLDSALPEALDNGADVVLVSKTKLDSEAAAFPGIPIVSETHFSEVDGKTTLGNAVVGEFDPAWDLEEIVANQTRQITEGVQVLLAKVEFVKTSRRLIDFLSAVDSYRD